MVLFSLTAEYCFDYGYLRKQSKAWQECCIKGDSSNAWIGVLTNYMHNNVADGVKDDTITSQSDVITKSTPTLCICSLS